MREQKNQNIVPLTEEYVKNYLDVVIRLWRKKKIKAEKNDDSISILMASCYVDAYQSVRISLFGELLAKEEEEGE